MIMHHNILCDGQLTDSCANPPSIAFKPAVTATAGARRAAIQGLATAGLPLADGGLTAG